MTYFRFLQWNCRGLFPKLPLLQRLLYVFHIDIFCLQEVKSRHPSSSVTLRGYSIFLFDGPNFPGGGLLFGVRSTIAYHQVNQSYSPSYAIQHFQVPISNKLFSVYNFYAPRGLSTPDSYTRLFSDVSHCLIVGDFNAHDDRFGSYKTTLAGKLLYDWYSNSSLLLLNNGSATHIHPLTSDTCVLDLSFASSSVASVTHWSVLAEPYDSDHFPIIIQVSLAATSTPYQHVYLSLPKFHPMLSLLESLPRYQALSLPEKLSRVSTMIRRVVKPRLRLHWWNPEVHRSIQNKRRYFRRARQQPSLYKWSPYRQACAQAQRAIRLAKRQAWEQFLYRLKDVHIFRIYRILKSKLTPPPPSSKFLKVHGVLIDDPGAQTQAFADHFTSYTSTASLDYQLTHPPPSAFIDSPFSLTELHTAIQATRSSAPGPDGIPSSFFKLLSPEHQDQLLAYFNQVWCSGPFPSDWLSSTLIPILKPGKDPLLLDSYRPIMLTSSVCKLQERMVLKRLHHYASEHEVFHRNQYGFLNQRSAVDCASAVYHSIMTHRKNKQAVVLFSLDIQKAYDHVDRNILLHYFSTAFPSSRCFRWLRSFLQPRSLRVRWNNHTSASHLSRIGVPQGSVLSPLLFNLYMRSLFSRLRHLVEIYMFADDIYLISSGLTLVTALSILQQAILLLEQWCKEHNLRISETKSKVMNCSFRQTNPPASLILQSVPLQWSSSMKILGITFSSNLRWSQHFSSLLSKSGVFLQVVKLLTSRRSGGSIPSLLRLVRSTLLPALTYGSFITGTAPKSVQNKLQASVNRSLRLILGLPRSCPNLVLYRESGVPPLSHCNHRSTLLYAYKHLGSQGSSQWSSTLRGLLSCPANQTKHFPPVKNFHAISRALQIPRRPLMQVAPATLPLPPHIIIHTHLFRGPKSSMLPTEVQQRFRSFQSSCSPTASWFFTDGAKSQHSCGFGVFIPSSCSSISVGISPICSSFTAEVLAIQFVLQHHCKEPGTYYIVTDNKSVLLSVTQTFRCSHAALLLLHHSLTALPSSCILHLVWIPSHMAVKENDLADAAAKSALNLPVHPQFLYIPFQDFKLLIISRCQAFTEQQWSTSKYASSHGHIPSSLHHQLLGYIPRNQAILLVQLRTFTAPLNAFLHQLRQLSSPNCASCGVPETVIHFLQDCPQFHRVRQLVFNSPAPSAHILLHNSYSSMDIQQRVIEFIQRSKRFK